MMRPGSVNRIKAPVTPNHILVHATAGHAAPRRPRGHRPQADRRLGRHAEGRRQPPHSRPRRAATISRPSQGHRRPLPVTVPAVIGVDPRPWTHAPEQRGERRGRTGPERRDRDMLRRLRARLRLDGEREHRVRQAEVQKDAIGRKPFEPHLRRVVCEGAHHQGLGPGRWNVGSGRRVGWAVASEVGH